MRSSLMEHRTCLVFTSLEATVPNLTQGREIYIFHKYMNDILLTQKKQYTILYKTKELQSI